MVRFCSTCNKEHQSKDWYPILTYGIRLPTSYHCPLYLNLKIKPKLKATTEHIPESMKEDRKENAKSMLQPWREGEPSAEFIQAYPQKAEKMFTPKERMKAKPVWKDILPTNWERTR